ncbi:hypothetical protein SAMN02745947_02316 [Rhodococcus rhodochrous J3]|uniref:Uncharacterized protein n=1 Tax=Rhodococcus rhodochrous J3 TaxID=903528 RepID=A0ABY1MA76_RHORH|nr:hypothetical protein [Rhodococcus rhodochrous]SMG34874.1 hypothetical protein SAMN02745947_02316 [Rhodococcus rhodochrous J3]
MRNARALRVSVSLIGALTVIGLVVFNSGFAGRTLASWNDRVFGSAKFGIDSARVQGYAQALAGRFVLDRTILSDFDWDGVSTTHGPLAAGTTTASGSHHSGNFSTVIRLEENATACASYIPHTGNCAQAFSGSPAGYATSSLNKFEVTALGIPLVWTRDKVSVRTSATCPAAGPMMAGSLLPTGGSSSGAGIFLRKDSLTGSDLFLPFPSEPPATGGETHSEGERSFGSGSIGFVYKVRLTRTTRVTENSAMSQLRIRIRTVSALAENQQWEVDAVLAHAECGVGVAAPNLPPAVPLGSRLASLTSLMLNQLNSALCPTELDKTAPSEPSEAVEESERVSLEPETIDSVEAEPIVLPLDADSSKEVETGEQSPTEPSTFECRSENTASETKSATDLLIEEGMVGEPDDRTSQDLTDPEADSDVGSVAEEDADPEGKPVDPESSQAGSDTSVVTDGSAPYAESEPSDTSAVGEPTFSVSDPNAESETTVLVPRPEAEVPSTDSSEAPPTVPRGPVTPTRVRLSAPFSVVTKDGDDLGTMTIDDVSRTPGCVAARLTMNTSDGVSYLNGLRPSDFREVLADGDTARVGSVSGECVSGASLPSSFDPASHYSGWVTFGVTDSSRAVMLRPTGTAGWIIDLPPPTPVTPMPVVTTSPGTPLGDGTTEDTESEEPAPETTEDAAPAVSEDVTGG